MHSSRGVFASYGVNSESGAIPFHSFLPWGELPINMNNAHDDVAFLANSENRVAVFETLAEAPRSRTEIREEVDASRVTVARILREFEERDWIEQSNREFTVTPLGEWVCEAFTDLVGELEAENRLREVLRWFPSELLTFDVRCLRDAEIILLDGSDSTALLRRIIEFHRSGDRLRGIAQESAPQAIENHWELTVHGDTRIELGITPDILDAIRDHPPSSRRFQEMLDEESATYFVCEQIPISVGIVDGTVGINLTDAQGVLKGGLVTDDETVHAWAVDLFERYRERGRPVESEAISA